MTDPQFELLRSEIRDGFKACQQRDAVLGQKIDALQESVSDVRFALGSIMNKLLAPSENEAIRSKMKNADSSADAR